MQHPDEGTIHSWLDGALSAGEAARVETHVKECPQCAAAVAEARGFIAGASRILTALDNAPRGVIPAAVPKKRVDAFVWRVAATVLVVAAGTLVVVRNQGGNQQPTSALADSVPMSQQGSIVERAPAVMERGQIAADAAAPKAVSNAPKIAPREKAGVRDSISSTPAFESKVLERGNAMQAPQSAGASGYVGAAAPTPSTRSPARVTAGFVAMDSASQPEPLKVVGTPRRIGAKVTLYEVAPGDTVTLTEAVPISLDAVVVTSAGAAPKMAQGASKSARSTGVQSKAREDAAAIPKASDSSRAAGPPSAPAIAAPTLTSQAGIAGIPSTVHAITWTDSVTKGTLTLTGRMPEARLQEIRIRIERERAAAAAKKNP